MSLYSKLKKTAKKAKAAAQQVGKAVSEFTDKVEDVANTVGNAIGNAIETASNVASGWAGGLISGAGSLLGVGVRGLFNSIGGMIGGIIKTVVGSLTLNVKLIMEGIADGIAPVVGAAIMGLLGVASLVQRTFGGLFEAEGRALNPGELQTVKRIFQDSINYDLIRLVVGKSGLFGINSRAFVLGNTIYMKDSYSDPRSLEGEGLLVHEVTHVWQFQNKGIKYISEAWYAQNSDKLAYEWDRNLEYNNTKWEDLNREAQGAFFQDLHKHGRKIDRGTNAVPPRFNYPGSFFVDTKKSPNIEPFFPWHSAPIDPPYPLAGHVFESMQSLTAFAIKATETVRDG